MSGQDALASGMHLGHRYRLVDRLGQGGMASVWRALDQVLDRPVAVKVLQSAFMADRDFLDRFRVEARSAAQLSHPHITSVFDYGEWEAPSGRRVAFIVMELLHGESLAARLQRGPLPWPRAVTVCAQVAEALAAAHRRGVVHRDVKPGNVVLTDAGAKVLDFGIAGLTGEQALTPSGRVLGTAAYVAPELLAGGLVTPSADVYGLGVVLFEALTGEPPARGDGAVARRPLQMLPGLPDEIALLDQRCLAAEPAERPSSAEVAKRLRAALGAGAPHSSSPLPSSASDTALLPVIEVGPPAPPRRRGRPRQARRDGRGWALGAALGAAALIVAMAAALLLRPPPAGPAASTTATQAVASPTSTGPPSTTQAPPLQPLEALERLRRGVDDGVASGEIRPDAGRDLGNLLDGIQERLASGRLGGLDRRVGQLRRKLEERLREGAISPDRALDLARGLRDLSRSLPEEE